MEKCFIASLSGSKLKNIFFCSSNSSIVLDSVMTSSLLSKFAENSQGILINSKIPKITEHYNSPFTDLPPDNVLYKTIKIQLNKLLDQPQSNSKFLGNMCISLMRSDMKKLYHDETTYAVLEKTDGVRFLMFITSFQNQPVVVCIDQGFSMKLFNDLVFDEELSKGSIFDVEYLYSQNVYTFFFFDTLSFCGEVIQSQHYIDRLEHANVFISHLCFDFKEINLPIHFTMKEPYPINKLREFCQDVLPQRKKVAPTDGLIFVPLENSYKNGQDLNTFKWKPVHTVDFQARLLHNPPEHLEEISKLQITSDQVPIELWSEQTKGGPVFYAITTIYSKKLQRDYHCSSILELDNKIVECRFSKEEKRWIIEKIRFDKKKANHIHTVKKTVKNMEENIQIEELFCQCQACKKSHVTGFEKTK
jgi:hypothetical protein